MNNIELESTGVATAEGEDVQKILVDDPAITITAGSVQVETVHGPIYVHRELSPHEIELLNKLDADDLVVLQSVTFEFSGKRALLSLYKEVWLDDEDNTV